MIVHEIELIYTKTRTLPHQSLTSSRDVEAVLRQYWTGIDIYESFYAIHLNRANNIIGIQRVGTGGIHATVVDCKLIMAASLKGLATALIVAHNHPSGSLKPSSCDKKLTAELAKACTYFKITLCDHLILHPEQGYFSFADEGVMP